MNPGTPEVLATLLTALKNQGSLQRGSKDFSQFLNNSLLSLFLHFLRKIPSSSLPSLNLSN